MLRTSSSDTDHIELDPYIAAPVDTEITSVADCRPLSSVAPSVTRAMSPQRWTGLFISSSPTSIPDTIFPLLSGITVVRNPLPFHHPALQVNNRSSTPPIAYLLYTPSPQIYLFRLPI